MNQTPAAVLVLAASVCGYAACTRAPDSFGLAIGLAGIAFGMWGVLSLVNASTRPRHLSPDQPGPGQSLLDGFTGHPPVPGKKPSLTSRLDPPITAARRMSEENLSPEISAQLSLVAHMQGQDRKQILEELLQRHLPRYTNHRR